MTCNDAQSLLSLALYGELSFDEEEALDQHLAVCSSCHAALERERRLHLAVSHEELAPSLDLLQRCRAELQAELQNASRPKFTIWQRLFGTGFSWFTPVTAYAWLRPATAFGLLAVGFLGGRWQPPMNPGAAPLATRVRYVEPSNDGRVRIGVEETQERVLSGHLADENIRSLLVSAAREAPDPGLRVESMDLLKTQPGSDEVRRALVTALLYDSNAVVRLKALDGLRPFTGSTEVRKAVAQSLMTDQDAGVRTQAIDLLTTHHEPDVAGVLQELLQRDQDTYVRQRCQKALREMNASLEMF